MTLFTQQVTNDTDHADALRRAVCEIAEAIGHGEPSRISFHLDRAGAYARMAEESAWDGSPAERLAAQYMKNYVADVRSVLRRQWAPAQF